MRFLPKVWYVMATCFFATPTLIAYKPNPKPNNNSLSNTVTSNADMSGQTMLAENKPNAKNQANAPTSATCNNQALYQAFTQHNENQKIQVLGCGQVRKVLKDDTDGSRHQKFLITIDGYPQISVLVAHNIDLARRVDNIQPNTPIKFYGEYIYNDKGGVLHWTHKDPTARHQDGWLEYNGQKYW